MKITDAPTPIATPFAQKGTRNDIPDTDPGFTGDATGRAAFATGFPDITMRPITAGGVPPFGADFNGILYALSNAVRFYGAGGHYKFNADFAAKIGGYPMGATVQATDNMGHWLNVVEPNSIDPESGLSTGWLPLADHNGTATVTLTASAALTPLQAAKANIRFTGTPTGNVTVTFPAWTKRYSIINDCAGDGTIICTTGNGESISIKNGAKYEVGCDGKNLTVATVNASQVFAEPNKNISALDAPTVQQLLNALGSAAARAASDFDAKGSADAVQKNLSLLSESLKKVAITGDITDTTNNLPWERVSGLGDASKKGFFDTGDADKIEYGDTNVLSTGGGAAIRDQAKSALEDFKRLFSFDKSSGNGSFKLPGGMIVQWAVSSYGKDEVAFDVYFKTAFPNACLMAFVCTQIEHVSESTDTFFQLVNYYKDKTVVMRQSTFNNPNDAATAAIVLAVGY